MEEHRPAPKRSLRTPLRWVGIGVRALLGPPARAVRGTARRVADPARQVVDYWSSERVTMRQGFVAVCIAALTSLAAGLTLAGMDHRIDAIAGLFLLIPVSIGMRGNIFGALSARIGTSIHSGLFEVTASRTGILFQNVYAAALLTVFTSVAMGILARAIASLLGVDIVSVWDLITVALVGGLISSAVVLAVTIVVSITALRRGWDLDSVGSPLITAIGDVVTLPCLFLASYLVAIDLLTPAIGVIGTILGAAALVHGWTVNAPLARRIVRESVPVLCIAIVLDILAGSVVEPRIEEVFLPLPAFLIIIPGFLENTGALGGILSARLGSKLHLGAVTPRAKPEPAALLDGTLIFALGITVYTITAVATLAVAALFDQAYPGAASFIGVVLLGGVLATCMAAFIGYYGAILSYRFGFDPDNHTIPLVTSGMDLLGIICLVFALGVFRVT
jgi:mgtE-like transporter